MGMERSLTFETYSGNRSYEDIFETAFNAKYVVDLIKAVWGAEPPYKLLDCGSANGLWVLSGVINAPKNNWFEPNAAP
jgi:hypothetical protein